MKNKIIAGGLALFLTVSGYFAHEAIGDTRFGAFLHALTTLTLPFQSTDDMLVERAGVSQRTPATSVLQTANNLSDVPSKTNSRWNLGNGSPSQNVGAVSLMDYGADPTGVSSSDAAFVACSTSGHNCYIPPGTYQIACTTHNATNNIMIYGDNPTSATLKLPAACAMVSTGLINLANMQNLTVDMNNATLGGAASRILSNYTTGGAAVNFAPSYQNIRVVNATTNFYLIDIDAFSNGNVFNPLVRNNFLQLTTASGASPNQCIRIFLNGTSTINGGEVSANICSNTGMDLSAWNLLVRDNDISGWQFNTGIKVEQNVNSYSYHIINNRVHDSGTASDLNGNVLDGIFNWGQTSEISNNRVWNVAGACIDNGGQSSVITGNWCENSENRTDLTPPLPAFFSLFGSSTFNGSNSSWIGNYGVDTRGTGARQTQGYGEATGLTGIVLSGNVFVNAVIPYEFN